MNATVWRRAYLEARMELENMNSKSLGQFTLSRAAWFKLEIVAYCTFVTCLTVKIIYDSVN